MNNYQILYKQIIYILEESELVSYKQIVDNMIKLYGIEDVFLLLSQSNMNEISDLCRKRKKIGAIIQKHSE